MKLTFLKKGLSDTIQKNEKNLAQIVVGRSKKRIARQSELNP